MRQRVLGETRRGHLKKRLLRCRASLADLANLVRVESAGDLANLVRVESQSDLSGEFWSREVCWARLGGSVADSSTCSRVVGLGGLVTLDDKSGACKDRRLTWVAQIDQCKPI